ncbi:protoporphyrinogen oxidase [Sporosarcina obsidiansis]|uniref:protoporphyrinogen oxidase n=1 Tax=Sporosarcina obsidiansis TaxID=2660748 RepID=UPI00129BBA33|nr:protoporphyrinogen oxidase [Sporosarcina obsidiansis]
MNPLTIETIELCAKETEETLRSTNESFLKEPISYLKSHVPEFLYVASPDFDEFKVDSLVFEVDDIFGTYMVLFGLQGKKKEGEVIRSYIESTLQQQLVGFSISFSDNEGLWEVNLPLDPIEGFKETMTIEQVLQLFHEVLGGLRNEMKAGK